jgi:hypothetical protein
MDLTASIVPRSDQLNADDLISGPVTITVDRVVEGAAEQPVDIHTVEFPGRAYRPSKSMLRVLVATWGAEGSVYTGRQLTIYRDPEVTFGRDKVGGIKISHLSHIDAPKTLALTVTRGKRAAHTVKPLQIKPPAPSAPTPDDVAAETDLAALSAMWKAHPTLRAQIEARVFDLKAAAGDEAGE